MSGGYDAAHFENLFAAEDRHFWFRARNQVILRLTAKAVADLQPGYHALELGCGDGNALRYLEKACVHGTVIGMDYFAEGLRYARQRTACALVRGDLSRSPFGGKFQFIGIFDVLEHMEDDCSVLRDVGQMLGSAGALLLTVPAHQSLWSSFDEASGHCRRYTKSELERKLIAAGYRIEFLSEYMAGTYPLMWLSRRLGRRRIQKGDAADIVKRELRIIPGLNYILYLLLAAEARWIGAFQSLPIGSSLVALARKL